MRLVVLVSAPGSEVVKVTADGAEVSPIRSAIEFLPAARDGRGGVLLTLDLPDGAVFVGGEPEQPAAT